MIRDRKIPVLKKCFKSHRKIQYGNHPPFLHLETLLLSDLLLCISISDCIEKSHRNVFLVTFHCSLWFMFIPLIKKTKLNFDPKSWVNPFRRIQYGHPKIKRLINAGPFSQYKTSSNTFAYFI